MAVAVDWLAVPRVVLGIHQPHVAAGQVVQRVVVQAQVLHALHHGMLFQERGDPLRVLAQHVHLAAQGAHVVDAHHRLQRVQVGAVVTVGQVLDV